NRTGRHYRYGDGCVRDGVRGHCPQSLRRDGQRPENRIGWAKPLTMPYLTPNTPPANRFICRRLRIPASADFLALVTGALASLIYEKNYEPHGSYSPADTAQAFKRMLADMETGDCMIGEIKAFMRETLPDNCLPCDGSVYNRADYP